MATLETSIVIGKPVEQVFAFLTDLQNLKKLSEYVTGVEASGPVNIGLRYKIQTTSMGRTMETMNEVVSLEPNRKFGVKTLAAPPASDVTNTYLLEPDGSGTRLSLVMDAMLTPPGMPNMPGMEDMMKTQMLAGLNSSLAVLKKAIEA